MRKVGTIVSAFGILVLGLGLAQPRPAPVPPTPPSPHAPPFPPQGPVAPGAYYDYKLMEKAMREISKASYLQSVVQGYQMPTRPTWMGLADQLLRSAQADLQGQDFFAARERAAAAKDIYEAALGTSGHSPFAWGPRGPGRFDPYREAYRAQERVSRLEAELAYYRNSNPAVRTLLNAAKGLLGNQPWVARKLADAGLHIIRAERGF